MQHLDKIIYGKIKKSINCKSLKNQQVNKKRNIPQLDKLRMQQRDFQKAYQHKEIDKVDIRKQMRERGHQFFTSSNGHFSARRSFDIFSSNLLFHKPASFFISSKGHFSYAYRIDATNSLHKSLFDRYSFNGQYWKLLMFLSVIAFENLGLLKNKKRVILSAMSKALVIKKTINNF